MSQIRWKFNGMPNSYTTEQLEGAGWTYPQICQYGKPVYEASAPAWVGVGLPPVGIQCETLWSSTTGEYAPVLVVGHDEDRAVVRFIGGERKGEYDSDRQHNDYGYPIFRPIRTAEQLAAEEREQQIEMLAAVISQGFREGKKLADVLYDAGARMPVKP